MREIITVCLGGCGMRLGLQFWNDLIDYELSNNREGKNLNSCYFDLVKQKESSFTPRTLFVDTDPADVLKIVESAEFKKINTPLENVLYSKAPTNRNYAIGCYTESDLWDGRKYPNVDDALRKEIEKCDNLGAVSILRNVGGGTGSGFGCEIIRKLGEEYSKSRKHVVSTIDIYPDYDRKTSAPWEVYNSILAFYYMFENASLPIILDTKATEDASKKLLGEKFVAKNFESCNEMFSSGLLDLGILISKMGFWKIADGFTPYIADYSNEAQIPKIMAMNQVQTSVKNARNVIPKLFMKENSLSGVDLNISRFDDVEHHKITTGVGIYRGLPIMKVEDYLKDAREKYVGIASYPSGGLLSYHVEEANYDALNTRATAIYQTTAVADYYRKMLDRLDKLWKKKKYLQMFTAEGMDEMEVCEAMDCVEKYISFLDNLLRPQEVDEDEGEDEDEENSSDSDDSGY